MYSGYASSIGQMDGKSFFGSAVTGSDPDVCLFVWCLTARQHKIGQFVPTEGGWNRLSWLRMANETQCIILYTLHNVTQFTIKHSSYKNATTGYLIVWFTCLNITLAPSPIPSRTTHSLFGILISLGGMQFCVMPTIVMNYYQSRWQLSNGFR